MIKLWCDDKTPPPDDSWRWFTDHWRAIGASVYAFTQGERVDVMSISGAREDWVAEVLNFFANASVYPEDWDIWPLFIDTH